MLEGVSMGMKAAPRCYRTALYTSAIRTQCDWREVDSGIRRLFAWVYPPLFFLGICRKREDERGSSSVAWGRTDRTHDVFSLSKGGRVGFSRGLLTFLCA